MTARRLHRWTWARRGTAVLFAALLVAGAMSWSPLLQGSVSATAVLDTVPIVDPLAAAEVVLGAGRITRSALVGASILLASAVLLGPVFCGWVCPLGLLTDANQSLRSALLRGRARAGIGWRASSTSRLLVLGAVLGFAAGSGVALFQALSPIGLLARGVLFGSWIGLIVIAALLAVEWLTPRVWCRSVCPLGALYGLVGRRGFIRVRVDRGCSLTPCRQCTRTCPMGIRVLEDHVHAGARWVDDPLCTRCGACADVCPRDILHLGVGQTRDDHSSPCGVAS